jgi:hypothetical protein
MDRIADRLLRERRDLVGRRDDRDAELPVLSSRLALVAARSEEEEEEATEEPVEAED